MGLVVLQYSIIVFKVYGNDNVKQQIKLFPIISISTRSDVSRIFRARINKIQQNNVSMSQVIL